jgi:D-3-phosphoglycerate dehydrogenase / 2-oxoglutarate reductase
VFDSSLAHDPPCVERVDVATLCAEADLISLHAPLTSETHHAIGAAEFARMRPSTIIVNTARGGLIDEAALVEALREGRIFGAGIDVFEREPPPPDHPLLALDNVVLSDHTAWYSEASVRELQTRASQEIARVFGGQAPRSWVNRW